MKLRKSERGFALPTIVLASVILMMLLAGALSIASSNSVALREQYNNQIIREAAEAGVQYATACYYQVVSTATAGQWPNTGTLDTGEDCYGTPIAGTNCGTPTATAACYVISNGNVRTRFSVTFTPDASSPTAVAFSAVGFADKIRTSDNSVYSTSKLNVSKSFSIDFFGVASGNDTTCSILGGKLYCWGKNSEGQVGIGTATHVTTPQLVTGKGALLSTWNVVAVATGISHTCAIASTTASITDAKKMLCWGENASGIRQFGISSPASSLTPYLVNTLSSNYAISISARDHNCILAVSDTDSTLRRTYCWGKNINLQAGEKDDGTHPDPKYIANWLPLRDTSAATLNGVLQIMSISGGNSCGINSVTYKQVYCGGNGTHGMLGNNTTADSDRANWVQITGTTTKLGLASKVVTNNGRACALSQYNADSATTSDANYHVWCWGANWDYDAGKDDWRIDSGAAFYSENDRLRAKRVHTNITTGTRTCVYDPTVGTNGSYDCATIAAAGHTATNLFNANVSDIAASDWNMCLVIDGIVYCSGYNYKGQLGQQTAIDPNPTPNTVVATTCPSTNINSVCKLTTADKAVPVLGPLKGKTVVSIAGGNNHFCAITLEHLVYCWGANDYGQLGDGTKDDRSTPVRAGTPVDIVY